MFLRRRPKSPPKRMRMPKMTKIMGQKIFQKSPMYPLACKNKPSPRMMTIKPMTTPAIIPPLGKPKHSPSTRL